MKLGEEGSDVVPQGLSRDPWHWIPEAVREIEHGISCRRPWSVYALQIALDSRRGAESFLVQFKTFLLLTSAEASFTQCLLT